MRWVIDKQRAIVKERENLYIKEWEVESRDNLVILWYASSEIYNIILSLAQIVTKAKTWKMSKEIINW